MQKFYTLALLLLLTVSAAADSYYFCDFEDATENSNWQLNTPRNESSAWYSLWYIGSATYKDGGQSLYISADNGNTAGYSRNAARIVVAWREFDQLDPGEYDLAFDWKNVGDSAKAGLRVAWVPESQFGNIICGLNDDISTRKWLTDNQLTFSNGTILHASSTWSHAVTKLTIDGTPHRLVFVYCISGTAAVANPGACIDNVQIARNNCGTPTDLNVEVNGQYATLTWTSSAESFNLRYSKIGESVVHYISDLTTPKTILPLEHGAYTFYIQVICNGEASVWYEFPVVIVYDSKCFNYLDITDEQCFFLEETEANWLDNEKYFATAQGKKIDYGFQSIQSRHTIHYMPDELDARTYNSIDSEMNPVSPLRTVPDGAIASVRIGSWEETAHVARITYDFSVDTTEASVIMLKYALVLQSSGHPESQRPRFTLKIVDADTGDEVSSCTTVDFAAETSGDGWYRSPRNISNPSVTDARDVCWRDWTTVGLNLAGNHQRNLRVILTVYGCTAEVHYGYAYFTLDCTTGGIGGINCGDTPTNEFIAPEGFDYQWYLPSDPDDILSTDRVFNVQYDDDKVYNVDVIYKTDDACRFTLTACAIPRYPVPEATYEVYQKDCKNYIRFTNNSHVRTRNLRTGEVTEYSEYPIESTVWDFDGLMAQTMEWDPEIEAPAEGGTYRISLTAGVGLCDSTQYIDIVVPAIAPDTITETHDLCLGQSYTHQGKTYTSDTTIVFTGQNIYGCDSIHTLQLRFLEAILTDIYDTIPAGSTYEFAGQSYDQTGDYSETYPSAAGCDSIVTLHLYVQPLLQVSLLAIEEPCADAPTFDITFEVTAGQADSCYIAFADSAHTVGWRDSVILLSDPATHLSIPVPHEVRPDTYPLTLRFASRTYGSCEIAAAVQVHYANAIIQQRWNDVLGILNATYNGGYNFVAYQWYKNGEPIEGAIYPYYYAKEELDPTATYSVALTRVDESLSILSCDYIPTIESSDTAPQQIIKYQYNGTLYIQIGEQTYNVFGQPIRKPFQ